MTMDEHDAKSQFDELLDRVAAGEDVTITRHGVPSARLVSVRETSTADSRRRAIEMMRQLSKHNRLGDLRVQDLIAEGRR